MDMDSLRPPIIYLGDEKYYTTDSLRTYDPVYFHGCSRTSRKIIEKKSIDSDYYVYATLSKKHGWKLSTNQNKPSNKAKALLIEDWVIENVPKMKPDSNETKEAIAESEYEYPEAPDLLRLEESEKFKDDTGESVEIETRGERTANGVYFLAKDVSTAFEMPNLNKTLMDTRWDYNKGEHHKTFICNNDGTYKKTLFMTYGGMLRIIFSSRNLNTKYNDIVLMNWVQNVAGICQLVYEPNLLSLQKHIGFAGIVYFASCDILNGIKIGFWRSSLHALYKRYLTTYGNSIKILFCRTQNAPKLEKLVHMTFKHYNISNEIYRKDKIDEYLSFIKNDKKLKIYDFNDCGIDEIKMKTEFEIIFKQPTRKIPEFQTMSDHKLYNENEMVKCYCVFSLGIAKDLRKPMELSEEIPDNYLIILNTSTEEINPMLDEKIKTYENIKGVKLELLNHVYIDPQYTSDAETSIKKFLKAFEYHLQYKSYDELMAINPKHEEQIKEKYDVINHKFSGCIKGLKTEIDNLKYQLKDKDRVIEQKNIIIEHIRETSQLKLEAKDLIIANKDIQNELLALKLQNAISKHTD